MSDVNLATVDPSFLPLFTGVRGRVILRSSLPEVATWHIYPLCKDDSVPPKTSVLGGGRERWRIGGRLVRDAPFSSLRGQNGKVFSFRLYLWSRDAADTQWHLSKALRRGLMPPGEGPPD